MALELSCVSKSLHKRLPKFTLKEKSNSYSPHSYAEIQSIERNLKFYTAKFSENCMNDISIIKSISWQPVFTNNLKGMIPEGPTLCY